MDLGCFPSKRSLVYWDIILAISIDSKSCVNERKLQHKICLPSDWFIFFGSSGYWVPYLFFCTIKIETVFRHRMYMIMSMVSLCPEKFCRQLQLYRNCTEKENRNYLENWEHFITLWSAAIAGQHEPFCEQHPSGLYRQALNSL